jgi:hypothetical protein
MKTSLIIEDAVFEEAKREASKSGNSISEIISQWAALGRELWRKKKEIPRKKFKPLDLGLEKIDLINRKEWMEDLDDDRS